MVSFAAAAGKFYLCNWLIKFEPGGSFIFYSTLLINWEKCALTNVLSQKHSSISLAYIEKWSNRDVQSPKHLSAACLTGEIRLCWQNEFLFTTGQFPSSNFSKRFNFFVLFFGRTQERRLSVIQRLSIQQLPPSLVTWLC